MRFIIIILVSISNIICGCKEKSTDNSSKNINTPNEIIDYPNGIIDDTDIAFGIYKEYQIKPNPILLDSLNSMSCRSDASLAEGIDDLTTDLYRDHFPSFTDYLYQHQGSCLEKALISGIGADLFVEERSKRASLIEKLATDLNDSTSLSPNKKKYILSLIRKVNPNALD
ncbi:hypothetical protein [Hymenobacter algoricola]|uniref:DUF4375 domain-containing protein n=1 Tax=Hymenobacter algoricola TaxID=486267 RepID=A0ABP7MEB3_9BACT